MEKQNSIEAKQTQPKITHGGFRGGLSVPSSREEKPNPIFCKVEGSYNSSRHFRMFTTTSHIINQSMRTYTTSHIKL